MRSEDTTRRVLEQPTMEFTKSVSASLNEGSRLKGWAKTIKCPVCGIKHPVVVEGFTGMPLHVVGADMEGVDYMAEVVVAADLLRYSQPINFVVARDDGGVIQVVGWTPGCRWLECRDASGQLTRIPAPVPWED
jgi:hypothetical protein